MKKTKLGRTDIWVTPVGMGVLTIGNTQLDMDLEGGADIVRYAYEKGIRFFDTAQYYGTYPFIREAFKGMSFLRDDPDRPIISSKSLVSSYEEMEQAIEECLEELDIDYIDIFKLHEVRQDPDFGLRAGAWQALKDYKAKGMVGAIGVSTHHIDVVRKMADEPDCDIVFPLINYAGLGIRKGEEPGTAEEMAQAIEECISKGKGVFGMKAFGGGNLSGEYRKALDYVRDTGVHSIMVGLGSREEVDRLVEYGEGILPEDYMPDISEKRIRVDQGDCEGCGNCITRCPNKAMFRNEAGLADVDHDICLTCGYCAPVCPVRAIIMW